MTQDEFSKLYRYMAERFDSIDAALELKADKADVDGLYNRFDDVLAELEDIKTEQATQRVQLDRHERWHHETANRRSHAHCCAWYAFCLRWNAAS